MQPKREILSIMDMGKWKKSKAYKEYLNFINNLNDEVKGCNFETDVTVSENCQKVLDLIVELSKMVDQVPPIQQPQRFGNKAFKTWLDLVKQNVNSLLKKILTDDEQIQEVGTYLVESFGNDTRIDYGTGHEMAFAMFLMCLYKLDILKKEDSKAVINKIFNEYLILARKLQVTYKMEPAGSHGVWSLDDFQFLPFIFGSSQLIGSTVEQEKFVENDYIEKYKDHNMFFSCLKYIITVKTGPFAEHSNQLWNVSMVPGWNKINTGLIKMYTAEVLEKFPVVQHVLFGSYIIISP